MDISSIATASVNMYQSQTQQSVDVAMIKKAMDVQEAAAANLIETLKEPVPSFGYLLDIKV
jgi:hypothetical protein